MKRILLADDNAMVRKSLRRMLEFAGWIVCAEAANGLDAIAKTREFQPDLIVLDFSMPFMNGLTAGSILRQQFPKIPLILFTSFAHILNANDLQRAGFSALIDKTDAGKLIATAATLVDDAA